MGKTAFVLSMTRTMAVEHNAAVAFFSLEMSSVQLVNRLISAETEIDAQKSEPESLVKTNGTDLRKKLST
jgi:replicative DNA helicase